MPAFTIEEMTENSAAQIASWKYPPPYELYSFGGNAAEREELLNGLHFAAYQASLGEEPCGFIALGWSAQIQDPGLRKIYDDEAYTDIAFGLRPDLCGRGYGAVFVQSAVDFTRSLFPEDGIRLTVACENKRACRLYEKLGFREIYSFETRCVEASRGRPLSMKIMIL